MNKYVFSMEVHVNTSKVLACVLCIKSISKQGQEWIAEESFLYSAIFVFTSFRSILHWFIST